MLCNAAFQTGVKMQVHPGFVALWAILFLLAAGSSIWGLLTGRLYAGVLWGTITRAKAPNRFWFSIFCGFFAAGLAMCLVLWATTGLQPVEAAASLMHWLFPG